MRRVRAGGAPWPGRLAARFALRRPGRPTDEAGHRHATLPVLVAAALVGYAVLVTRHLTALAEAS